MKRIIGGARPTGDLHIGHLGGMLRPFLDGLADADESFFVVADLHMLATDALRATGPVDMNVHRLVAQAVGAGIPPERTHFVKQSQLIEQGQMYVIAQSLVPWAPLPAQDSYRAMSEYTAEPPLGLLGYSVLEAADAVALQVTHMAVGEHNIEHARIAQRVVGELNARWGTALTVPAVQTGGRNVIGLDGQAKMSKSLGNAISLMASDEAMGSAVASMALWSDDETCVPAEILRGIGAEEAAWRDVAVGLREGRMTETEARRLVLGRLRTRVGPIREMAEAVLARPDDIDAWLDHGVRRARMLATDTLTRVRSAIGLEREVAPVR